MNFATKSLTRVAMIALIVAAASSLASAQLDSDGGIPQVITLNATLAESLTVNLSANAVSFNLTSGSATNAGSTPITATTSWVLSSGRNAVGVYAYFTNGALALTGGGSAIPSSAFEISNNGGANTALTNAVIFGGTGLQLENVAITNANRAASVNDVMAFNINLSALPQLPAAAYTGQLNIRAQATP